MLTELRLTNFRCFSDHRLELQKKTLLVGKNNAGKSTCVEALRLVSLVTERIEWLHLKNPPRWTDLPIKAKGVAPSLESIDIHRLSLFHNYADPPAVVSALFESGARLDVHIGPELALHAVVYDSDGEPAYTKTRIATAGIPKVSILPQIGPLVEGELIRDDSYVKQNVQTSRSSLHFRNQLRIFKESVPAFRIAVADSWHGIAVQPLMAPAIERQREDPLELMIRDGDFTAEVAWMGHGLQMWLQTIWFLTRNPNSAVLILDEPDVYMHADLQRRLIRMLMHDPRQFIIATHSPEMLAEVEPDSVVVLDRRRRVSRAATTSKAVQELLLRVGSVHNLSLARLASQRRLLLVEGDDVALLKRIQNTFDPQADRPVDTVPNVDIGGWSGWPSAVTLARFFEKNIPDEISIHCILDRDYFSDTQLDERKVEAEKAGIELIIWSGKELENFLVVPAAIARLIARRSGKNCAVAEVETAVKEEIEKMKDETYLAYLEVARSQSPSKGVQGAAAIAKPVFTQRWASSQGLSVVSGKELLTSIFRWAQTTYHVSLSIPALIHALMPTEVSQELKAAIRSITSKK